MDIKKVGTIEKIIGYTFKDKALLERAFTHSSASKVATENYESLEFLGDSILDFIVAKRLMTENPDAHEGALTQRRAEIVSQEPLEKTMEALELAKYMTVGKGEKVEHIVSNTKVASNLFEAIVGAVYMDSLDIECAEKFILTALKPYFDGSIKHEEERDFKTELNEYATKNKRSVQYVTVETSGAPHEPTFVIDVLIDGVTEGRGEGKNKKIAQQQAASIALSKLHI